MAPPSTESSSKAKDTSKTQVAGSAEEAFRVQEISGKGRGLVATRTIALGELLIDEEPLVSGLQDQWMAFATGLLVVGSVVAWLVSLGLRSKGAGLSFDLALLRGACLMVLAVFISVQVGGMVVEGFVVFLRVQLLSRSEKATFFDLSSGLPYYIPVLSEALTFRTNAVFNDLRGCVCPVTALVNHACVPSAIFSWKQETDRHQVHALREIQAGEEVAVSYVDLWQPSAARQHALRRVMRFNCACSFFSEATSESERRNSDHRRNVCGQLERGLPDKLMRGELEEAVKDLRLLRDLTQQELGGVDNLIARDMEQTLEELTKQLSARSDMNSKEPAEVAAASCTQRRGGDDDAE